MGRNKLPIRKRWIKIFEKNNTSIAFNVLHAKNREKKYPAYVSKHNLKNEKQVILLMIQDKEKWHYLVITRLSEL